jgi:hypothetical protein
MKINRSEYIRISRTILRKLFDTDSWGAGSKYEIFLKKCIKEDGKKIDYILKVLVNTNLIRVKPHKFGKKYYLNKEQRDKIFKIIKEKPRLRDSFLILILMEK